MLESAHSLFPKLSPLHSDDPMVLTMGSHIRLGVNDTQSPHLEIQATRFRWNVSYISRHVSVM